MLQPPLSRARRLVTAVMLAAACSDIAGTTTVKVSLVVVANRHAMPGEQQPPAQAVVGPRSITIRATSFLPQSGYEFGPKLQIKGNKEARLLQVEVLARERDGIDFVWRYDYEVRLSDVPPGSYIVVLLRRDEPPLGQPSPREELRQTVTVP